MLKKKLAALFLIVLLITTSTVAFADPGDDNVILRMATDATEENRDTKVIIDEPLKGFDIPVIYYMESDPGDDNAIL